MSVGHMKNFFKSWGLLLIAILVGFLAFYVAQQYLESTEESIRLSYEGKGDQMVDVVVASVDVEEGEAISPSNMSIAQLNANHLSDSAIRPDYFDQHQGSLLTVSMKSGEPLLTHFLKGRLIERFSDLLEVGERPVTLEVDTLTSNAGLLTVGDRVDIFLRGELETAEGGDDGASSGQDTMISLFQNIKVLAVDQRPLLTKEQPFHEQDFLGDDTEQFEYSSVTLAMKADDSDNLAFSSSLGDILFLLRNSNDDLVHFWEPVNQASITASDPNQKSLSFSFYGKNGVKETRSYKAPKIATISNSTPHKSGQHFVKSLAIARKSETESDVENDVGHISPCGSAHHQRCTANDVVKHIAKNSNNNLLKRKA